MYWNKQPINRKKRVHPAGEICAKQTTETVSEHPWTVTIVPPSPVDLSAFLEQHYVKQEHDVKLMEWCLSKCLVAVSVFDKQQEWVGFAMTLPLQEITLGTRSYEKVFYGNYLCVHTEHRGKRMAPVIIERCIKESQRCGYNCGLMNRVNFLNRNKAWPSAMVPLNYCETLPSKDEAFPRSIPYDPTRHLRHLREWLFEKKNTPGSIQCVWDVEHWLANPPFILRVCLDGSQQPVGAFAFLIIKGEEPRANGLFHVGKNISKTMATAIQISSTVYGCTSYCTFQPCEAVPFMTAAKDTHLTVYTFGCSSGKNTWKDFNMIVF